MMKKIILLAIVSFLALSTLFSQNYKNAHVVVFSATSDNLTVPELRQISTTIRDRLESNLSNYADFHIIDATHYFEIKELQKRSESDFFASDAPKAAIISFGAEYALFPIVRKVGNTFSLSCNFINLTTMSKKTFLVAGKKTLYELYEKQGCAADEITMKLCERLGVSLSANDKKRLQDPANNTSKSVGFKSSIISNSDSNPRIFEFNGAFGVKTGEIREHVFFNGKSLSRLDWKDTVTPYFTVGGRVDIPTVQLGSESKDGVIIDADFSISIPGLQGTMDDWDFYLLDGKATHFSNHDLQTNLCMDFNVKAGYKFRIKKFAIIPQIGFMFRDTNFEGLDGYGQYTSGSWGDTTFPATYFGDESDKYWSSSRKKTSYDGSVITYEQKTYMPYINLEGQWKFYEGWSWSIFTSVSPFIYMKAYDNHETRKLYFLDELSGGLSIKAGSEIRWKLLCLGFAYEYLKIENGVTGQSSAKGKTYKKTNTTPGTDWNIWSFYVRIRI